MEPISEILTEGNKEAALKHLMTKKRNTAPGIDGMTVAELPMYLNMKWESIKRNILNNQYNPQPVRRVKIAKDNGGDRTLGIPTVTDRLIQLMIVKFLINRVEPRFSESSYGFRPGRNAHQAISQAQAYVNQGYDYVVELDIKDFFNNINHQLILDKVSGYVNSPKTISLIENYLKAGAMERHSWYATEIGTPQGGPLSPLVANIILNELDKELESHKYKFIRYADDVNLFMRTQEEAEAAKIIAIGVVENNLKLEVNQEKTQIVRPWESQMLGFTINKNGKVEVSAKAIKRYQSHIEQVFLLKESEQEVSRRVNEISTGWRNYFRGTINLESTTTDLRKWAEARLWEYKVTNMRKSSGYYKGLKELGIEWKRATTLGKMKPEMTANELAILNPTYWNLI